MASSDDDFSMKTMISTGSAFSGNLRVSGGMMVDGDIDGNVEISGKIDSIKYAGKKQNLFKRMFK